MTRDEAFCFHYCENIELLEKLGCEVVYFSPLADTALPESIGGLYITGGYPELYAGELSRNTALRAAIKSAIEKGLPTIAECGGFMYLHDSLDGFPMCGVIGGNVFKRERLQRFGYCELTAKRDNLLCRAGEAIRSHEFHYYDSDNTGADFSAVKPISAKSWDCVHANATLWAGFPHLYFPANPIFAKSFVGGAKGFAGGEKNYSPPAAGKNDAGLSGL